MTGVVKSLRAVILLVFIPLSGIKSDVWVGFGPAVSAEDYEAVLDLTDYVWQHDYRAFLSDNEFKALCRKRDFPLADYNVFVAKEQLFGRVIACVLTQPLATGAEFLVKSLDKARRSGDYSGFDDAFIKNMEGEMGALLTDESSHDLYVTRLYISPDYQGRGLGPKLLQYACDYFGYDCNIFLGVYVGSGKNHYFYKTKLGFEEHGRIDCGTTAETVIYSRRYTAKPLEEEQQSPLLAAAASGTVEGADDVAVCTCKLATMRLKGLRAKL